MFSCIYPRLLRGAWHFVRVLFQARALWPGCDPNRGGQGLIRSVLLLCSAGSQERDIWNIFKWSLSGCEQLDRPVSRTHNESCYRDYFGCNLLMCSGEKIFKLVDWGVMNGYLNFIGNWKTLTIYIFTPMIPLNNSGFYFSLGVTGIYFSFL